MNTLSGLNILLVEDEFLIALDAEEMLRDLGAATVMVVSTFEDAEKAIGESQFDLALLDVNLNGRKSFPLADLLAKKNTPVAFGTGYNLMARQMEGFKAGACASPNPTARRRCRKVSRQSCSRMPGSNRTPRRLVSPRYPFKLRLLWPGRPHGV